MASKSSNLFGKLNHKIFNYNESIGGEIHHATSISSLLRTSAENQYINANTISLGSAFNGFGFYTNIISSLLRDPSIQSNPIHPSNPPEAPHPSLM